MELHANRFWTIALDEGASTIDLVWTAETAAMSDDDFKEALELFADFASEHKAKGLLVGVRQFGHTMTPELGAWRDNVIVSKYNSAGVRQFVYAVGQGAPDSPPVQHPGGGVHDRLLRYGGTGGVLAVRALGSALARTVQVLHSASKRSSRAPDLLRKAIARGLCPRQITVTPRCEWAARFRAKPWSGGTHFEPAIVPVRRIRRAISSCTDRAGRLWRRPADTHTGGGGKGGDRRGHGHSDTHRYASACRGAAAEGVAHRHARGHHHYQLWAFLRPDVTAYNLYVNLNRYPSLYRLSDKRFDWV